MKNKPKPKSEAAKKFWQTEAFNQPKHGPQQHKNQFNVKNSGMGRRTSRGR